MIAGHGTGQAAGHGLANWPVRGQSVTFVANPLEIFPEQQTDSQTSKSPASLPHQYQIHKTSGATVRTGTGSVRGACPCSYDARSTKPIEEERGLAPSAVPVPDLPTRLKDSTNKRPCRETKHPNVWKKRSKLLPPKTAEKPKGSGLFPVDRLKKSPDDSKSLFIGLRLFYFTGQILQSMWPFWS